MADDDSNTDEQISTERHPARRFGGKRPPQKSLPSTLFAAAEAEEDDDESDEYGSSDEEDEEEEEDYDEENRKRATKKPRRNVFVDEEAVVDEDEDEDEEYEEEVDKDFIDEANEAEAVQSQLYRKVDRRRETDDLEDVDEVTARLKARYGGGQYAAAGEYLGDADRVPMQFLLPTPRDPNLWLIKCKIGREREIAFNLMRKYVDYAQTEHALRIKSVIARDNLKGYIYVEARSMADVQTAIDKLNNVYASKITIIPIGEMVDVVTIRKKMVSLKPGNWVRLLRGKYKGDLGQIVDMLDTNESAIVKVIPRLDTADITVLDSSQKRKMNNRPPQRLFNRDDFPRGEVSRRGGMFIYKTAEFDDQGFLHRIVKLNTLQSENVTPSLDELAKFSISDNQQDPARLVSSVAEQTEKFLTATFGVGDRVYVSRGDLKNAQGVVQAVMLDGVVVKMKDEVLGEITMEPTMLTKLFQIGDHVRVVRGKYKDDMGMITQVADNIVTVFSDLSLEQISVFTKDIQSVAEVSITENQSVAFKVYDFVQVGPDTVAVIIKVERDQYRIIDQYGAIRLIKSPEITQKRDSKQAVALDVNQKTLQVNDKVKVVGGEFANREGSILHLYRSWAFVCNKDFVETSGVFVVRTRMLKLAGADNNNGSSSMARPARPMNAPMQRRDNILHKVVSITGGPHKGYQGVVKSVSETSVRVELNANGKVVNVTREQVLEKDEHAQAARRFNRFTGGVTPMVGAKTPNVFAGAQTPSYLESTRTPAWDAGAKTPAWDAGAKTPAWDVGARTPAWNVGAKTPIHAHSEGSFQRGGTRTPQTASSSNVPRIPTATSAWEDPSMDKVHNELPADWLLNDLCVRFREGPFKGTEGYVTTIFNGGRSGSIRIPENDRTVVVEAGMLDPVAPTKKDTCAIIVGDKREARGILIGMDHEDAIFKPDGEDFTIEPFRSLCKLAPQ